MKSFRSVMSVALVASLSLPTFAFSFTETKAAPADVDKIRDEGMNRSQAMATMKYLSDVIGARLTNSPSQRRANKWTKEQLEKWGMKNAIVDPWGEFGKGWELKRYSATAMAGDEFIAFRAYPKAWSPSTAGVVTSNVVFVDATDEAGLEKYKGKLKGAIVFTAPERPVEPGFKPIATRVSDDELKKMEDATPAPVAPRGGGGGQGNPFAARKQRFYFEEGVAILVEPSMGTDSGTIRVMGASPVPSAPQAGPPNPLGGTRVYTKGAPATIPQLVAETEQYNRIMRLIKQGIAVKMSVDIEAKFYEDDTQGYNTIAEIPGTDLKDEVVMVGGHLDSWHSGNGSTDNGAGVTVAMEAMRIIAASGLKPRRTIKIGLWTGEEQGLLGSRGYVAKNLATLGDGSDNAAFAAMAGGPRTINKKAGYDKFAAYYNLDNGTGQIRGINMQGNESLRPMFKEWLAPFKDIAASTVSVNSVGGTDHLAFDAVGLPGFQFIQDPIEYGGRTWHTTQDVADRTLEEDLKRSAVIMATFAFQSAMTDEKLPRKPAAGGFAFASYGGGFDMLAMIDEAEFRRLGYANQVCGHDIDPHEIPADFPRYLTISRDVHNHAE